MKSWKQAAGILFCAAAVVLLGVSCGKTEEGKIDLDPFPDMDKKEGSDGEEKNDGPDGQA